MNDVVKIFGNNVKKFRKMRGLTQKELADLVGFTSNGPVSAIENGSRSTTMENVKKIADVLGVKGSVLLGWTTYVVDEFAPYLEKATEIQLEMVRLALGMPTKADKEKRDSSTDTSSIIKES